MAFFRLTDHMADFPSCLIASGSHTSPENRLIVETASVSLAEVSAQGSHHLMSISGHLLSGPTEDGIFFFDQRRRSELMKSG
jgi:hypothetical protein